MQIKTRLIHPEHKSHSKIFSMSRNTIIFLTKIDNDLIIPRIHIWEMLRMCAHSQSVQRANIRVSDSPTYNCITAVKCTDTFS